MQLHTLYKRIKLDSWYNCMCFLRYLEGGKDNVYAFTNASRKTHAEGPQFALPLSHCSVSISELANKAQKLRQCVSVFSEHHPYSNQEMFREQIETYLKNRG